MDRDDLIVVWGCAIAGAALALILTVEKTMQWQPIQTIPSATPVLATDGKVIVVLERGDAFRGGYCPHAVGFSGYEWEFDFVWGDLTHWMPLPPLPNERIA